MRDIEELVDGYHRFLDNRYPDDSTVYRDLAENGQSPHSMVIACSDSRVDPAASVSDGPGPLFVVSNVANMEPPLEPE
ncbi:MAG: carbonic anhydrase, partial [Pseudomonadota bacterium]|nr:carbonic anhydrase [Pseudomonadota bacterium]